jgi:hypothetical protein
MEALSRRSIAGITLYLTIVPTTLHFICICLQNVRILLSCKHQVLTGHMWIKIYQEHGQQGVTFFFPPFDARGWALTISEAAHVEIEYVSRLLTPSNSTFDPVKSEKTLLSVSSLQKTIQVLKGITLTLTFCERTFCICERTFCEEW